MFKKKKKNLEVIPVWEREGEYQRAYAKLLDAEENLDAAKADETASEEEISRLTKEWARAKEIFEPLYMQRIDWLRMTDTMPKREGKEKISKDTKLAAIVTLLGVALPPIIEYKGIIMRHAKDWVQKPRLWRK